jgi:hypothetical protein
MIGEKVKFGSSRGNDVVAQIQAGRNACLTLRWRDQSERRASQAPVRAADKKGWGRHSCLP